MTTNQPYSQSPYGSPAGPAPRRGKKIGLIVGAVVLLLLAALVAVMTLGGSKIKSYDDLKTELTALSQDNGLPYCYDLEDTFAYDGVKEEASGSMDKIQDIFICSNVDFSSPEAANEAGLDGEIQVVMGVYGKKGERMDTQDVLNDFASDSGGWGVGKERWLVVGITQNSTIKDAFLEDFDGKDLAG